MKLKRINHMILPEFIEEAEESLGNATTVPYTSTTVGPNTTDLPIHLNPCQWILYTEIKESRVRIWDLIILIPNVLFLLFLLIRLRTAVVKLKRTNSPIFFAFYGLVFLVAVISVIRCVVAMTVNAAVTAGDITDKILWLVLRFFLLATEMSVVIFGLAFGHLDSRTSIRRVLLCTSAIALLYSCTQGVLEFLYPDDRFHVIHHDREYDIFGHGGMLFWLISSIIFWVIYSTICVLPFTKLRERFALPMKKSFYIYCAILMVFNVTQAIGSGLLYGRIKNGMCVVDVTTYLYFTGFAPLVYGTFLGAFFATSQPSNILFSYKAQVDDVNDHDDDSHILSTPSSPYPTTQKPDGDFEEAMSHSFDSTHFDGPSPNPLYGADMQYTGINAELTMSMNSDYFPAEPAAMDIGMPPGVYVSSTVNGSPPLMEEKT